MLDLHRRDNRLRRKDAWEAAPTLALLHLAPSRLAPPRPTPLRFASLRLASPRCISRDDVTQIGVAGVRKK
ncbi:hypothetical protein E2C01_066361 [Portunus trituberculatus]|uniref:Uncharacterized protein n=1 Tax=Portunus trituberculatus TaxID=210409 RepID=A0A5B7HTM7_PORTR|nr:hypothetical protein [Portunus trituberculatus]